MAGGGNLAQSPIGGQSAARVWPRVEPLEAELFHFPSSALSLYGRSLFPHAHGSNLPLQRLHSRSLTEAAMRSRNI